MTHDALVLVHVAGALALGAAIVGVLFTDERARRARTLREFDDARHLSERLRRQWLAPAVMVVLASGAWLVLAYYGTQSSLGLPWLAAMAGLFTVEGVRANTRTRRHAVRLARLADQARESGRITAELDRARNDPVAAFERFLESTMFTFIVLLGVFRPDGWAPVLAGGAAALVAAFALARYVASPGEEVPRLFSRASVEGDGTAWSRDASTSRQRR